ncbi:MAG TPA: glycoside hydrolase family 3 N-terminal domain-containing protein [Candidatus Dormibacteraeota bacterium]|nr:glycoside hydrolase family 3 N-terminal domain-containing protein [Candidatus Dormibacteraeota bacterium]
MTDPRDEILGRLMLAFRGTTVPAWLRTRLATAPVAGLTLFRAKNVRSPAQLRRLTTGLQASAAARPGSDGLPVLIAADQEGGQFLALGDGWTPFAGPMAIGATGDAGLAERVGAAIGRELRAVGVNVDYGPVLDVAIGPENPSLGIRSFGEDPAEVGRLGAAWLGGLQSAGVAATAKHFPGAGGAGVDPHHALAVVERTRADLEAGELVPFRRAIEAGARLVMSGHFASPQLTGSRALPATLSRHVMTELLRDELGFDGVSITDALDMRALAQGAAQAVDVLASLEAGVDLLLATADRVSQRRIELALARAAEVQLLEPERSRRSAARVTGLRKWLGTFDEPALDVVGSAAHAALARELAVRSLTLVRDEGALLPLRIPPEGRILAIMPAPIDLTPADTSSFVTPTLAAALRAHHPHVDEVVTEHPPPRAEISSLRERAAGYQVVVAGTISAAVGSSQADLVRALKSTGVPLVTVALRTPWDLAAYPEAGTHVCTYSILRESMDALAAALFGRSNAPAFPGRLPVRIEGHAGLGHGLVA